jgi:acetone carboxylase gamma subunit
LKIELDKEEQGDWNKARRIMQMGAKIERFPEVLTILNQKYVWDGNSRSQIQEGWVQCL